MNSCSLVEPHDPRSESDSSGFVLLVLLSVVGVGSLGILLAVQALLPSLSGRRVAAETRLQAVSDAVHTSYRRTGLVPASLDAVAVSGGMSSLGFWRQDPYGAGQELDYAGSGAGAQIRSRGVDGVLGSGDDLQVDVEEERMLRQRQRLRLRLLRAVLSQSSYRSAAGMSAAEQTQMVTAMRQYALARRAWLTADAAGRSALSTQMSADATTIQNLTTAYSLPALPPTLTGAGGLMSMLGMPDGRAVDGRGVGLQLDSVLGWRAIGSDGSGGTDDDM